MARLSVLGIHLHAVHYSFSLKIVVIITDLNIIVIHEQGLILCLEAI